MDKNQVLDIIISFIKSMKSNKIETNHNNRYYSINSVGYLLNQIVRQYYLDSSHYCITKRAKEKWRKLTSKDINDYYYKEIIVCENEEPIQVKLYKNNSSSYEVKVLKKGDKFSYRSIFHNEHIIPINVIIKELGEIENPNYENVENVLNKICVCRMLKEEDRAIKAKSKRPYDREQVLSQFYAPQGIEIE